MFIDKISDAEAEVMRVVWECIEPATYAKIRAILTEQKGWESPTVNTLINRLVKKGALIQEKKEVYYYTPAVSEEQYLEAKTKNFVKKVYGGSVKGLLSALVSYGDMTKEEWTELQDLWDRKEK